MRRFFSGCLMTLLLLSVNEIAAQDAATELTDKEQKQLLKSHFRKFATGVSFKLESGATPKLLDPVYNWVSQDPNGFANGDVFVWQHEGRAAVIGCIGSFATTNSRYLFQEYHVLTREPVAPVTLEVAGEWAPAPAGIIPKPVATDLTPPPTKALRLAQMRRIAKDFQPFMVRGTKEDRLRLQPTPLYRFDGKELEKAKSEVVDGGIFAYVRTLGTDPELLLILECHKTTEGLRWMYAPVRFTYEIMRLEYDGSEVWKCVVDRGRTMRTPYVTTSAGKVDFDAIAAAESAAKSATQTN